MSATVDGMAGRAPRVSSSIERIEWHCAWRETRYTAAARGEHFAARTRLAERADMAKKAASEKAKATKKAVKEPKAKKPVKEKVVKEPKAKKATKKATRKKKVAKEARMKAFWGVFSPSMKRVVMFEYADKKAAEKKASELSASSRSVHFIQLVKEPIAE
jgi:hypothetical protein